MALLTTLLEPGAAPLHDAVRKKHFERKHGPPPTTASREPASLLVDERARTAGGRGQDARRRAARGGDPQLRAAPTSGWRAGESAMLPSAELEPAGDVPALEELPDADAGDALERVAVIKLNGGLATTMGLRSPSRWSRRARADSFLDIIIGQTLALRRRHGVAPAAGPDGQRGDARGDAASARAHPRARHRAAARLPAEHGPEARRRHARAGQLAAGAARSNGARPGTATSTARCGGSGMLDALLERGLPLRDDLQRRQPRRDAPIPRIAGASGREAASRS